MECIDKDNLFFYDLEVLTTAELQDVFEREGLCTMARYMDEAVYLLHFDRS